MQSVAEWQKTRSAGITPAVSTSGIQSVSEWMATRSKPVVPESTEVISQPKQPLGQKLFEASFAGGILKQSSKALGKIAGFEASFAGGLLKQSGKTLNFLNNIGKKLVLGLGDANKQTKEATQISEANLNLQNTIAGLIKKARDSGDIKKVELYKTLLRNTIRPPVSFEITSPESPFDGAIPASEEIAARMDDIADKMKTPKLAKAIGSGFGEFTGKSPLFYAGGQAIEASGLASLASKVFLNPKVFPTIGKYLAPFVTNTLQNLGAFEAMNQVGAENHWKQFTSDLRDSMTYSIAPLATKNRIITASADSLLTYGLAKIDGADDIDAIAGAVTVGMMAAGGLLGNKSVSSHEKAIETIKQVAVDKINEHSKTKITPQSTPEEINQAVKETGDSWVGRFLTEGQILEQPTKAPITPKTAPTSEITPKVGEVAPSLQPLAQEAQKYASAKDFPLWEIDNSKSYSGGKNVEAIKQKIQSGAEIPPIRVFRDVGDPTKYNIYDGSNRFQAYQELGIKKFPIQEVDAHGKPITQPLHKNILIPSPKTAEISKTIPKELQGLATEAQKYKSAEEFVKGYKQFSSAEKQAVDILNKYGDSKIDVYGSFSTGVRRGSGKAFPDLDLIIEDPKIARDFLNNNKEIIASREAYAVKHNAISETNRFKTPFEAVGRLDIPEKYQDLSNKFSDVKIKINDHWFSIHSDGTARALGDSLIKEQLVNRKPLKQALEDFQKNYTKSQLTDFYNQAVKAPSPVELTTPPKPIETKPTGKISGIAKSIEAKAIEQGLVKKGFDKLAEYNPAVIKEQSEMMSDIMSKDIERAKRIATGKEELPQGLKGATALSAMEDYAMEHKDGQLALGLANSPIATEISTAGQTLRLSAERTPDSATAKIREISKIREKVATKKLKGQTTDKAKTEIKNSLKEAIKRSKPNKFSWETLIKEITC